MLKRQIFRACALLLLLLVALSGCSRDAGSEQSQTPTTTTSIATIEPSPEPTPTAAPTPEPTPIPPGVVIDDQPLDESGVLVAEQVSLPEPGWLVIYRTVDGQPDEVIGRQSLAAGVHEQVEITIDTDRVTEQLLAGVHMDVGAEGVFEFPGEDEPYPGEPEVEFVVELLMPQPRIEVADQAIIENGVVTLALVEALKPMWVVIHSDLAGQIGPVIGARLFEPGTHENVTMTIDWRRGTPALYAVLHEDDGETGVLEYPDGDMPVLRSGEPFVAAFKATYPPEVLVYDQPVIGGAVTIERAISEGPGWVAIYNEVDGQPGMIIGTAPLVDGLNEAVTINLVQSAITSQLFARLHHDTEPDDAFNFPGQDPPVFYNNRLPTASAFRTDIGAHVFVQNQRLDENGDVRIAVVITPLDAWAALYSDNEGQPGELLGQTWVPAGISRDVAVSVDPNTAPGALHLVMYEDLGVSEEFEAPDIDLPLANDNNRPIRVTFTLNTPAE